MALPKLFQRIFWHNNTTPAINEDNLNAMSKAIDDIDNRVIALGDDVMTVVPQIAAYLEQAEDLVEAMELLSENPPYIGSNGNWYVWDTNTSAFVDSGVDASISVNIADITMLAPDAAPYVTNSGTDTDPIFHLFIPMGQTGNGISTIAKTGTSGLVDTYTITMTDGTTSTFTVTNGAGDMNKSVYDPTNAIANAGGMKSAAAKDSTNAVTANSTDLVESGAVYAKTEPLWDNMMDNGAVNLLSYPYNNTTKTTSGITYTDNGDGTISANGTSTALATFYVAINLHISKATKITGCPSGGANGSYALEVYNSTKSTRIGYDTGNGLVIPAQNPTDNIAINIQIWSGQTVSNLVFKPMLSDPSLNLSYDDYVPYAKSNRELTEELNNRLPLLIDSGLIAANSSKTISVAGSSSALYRLTLGSIGADGCGRIVIFGKHPSVANIKYATFDCVDISAAYSATISVSGNSLTITSATNSNCMYTLEQIRA